VKEFMGTMGFIAASLSLNCTDCHIGESAAEWSRYADDTPIKQTTRRMIVMVNAINQANFAGGRKVTCYTCHRGNPRPEVIPSLAVQYAVPDIDADLVEMLGQPLPGPSVDQILDKYIQALGGAQQLARLTSFSAKGTYEGFDSDFGQVPIEIFAKAPNQLATVIHKFNGDRSTIYDGREAWFAAPETDTPIPVLPLTEDDLDGAMADAVLSFPARIKQSFSTWRAGFPATTIDDRDVQIVEGTTARGGRIKLYFDKETGLLVRQLRYMNTLVGVIPTHIDYSDYRTVSGVKMPFQWVVTWTDGQATIKLNEVQPNAPINAARFGQPAPPAAPAR
jgi:outer membrane lipoprotein-sorting protein